MQIGPHRAVDDDDPFLHQFQKRLAHRTDHFIRSSGYIVRGVCPPVKATRIPLSSWHLSAFMRIRAGIQLLAGREDRDRWRLPSLGFWWLRTIQKAITPSARF